MITKFMSKVRSMDSMSWGVFNVIFHIHNIQIIVGRASNKT